MMNVEISNPLHMKREENNMWYHVTKYSFDPTKSVQGPFATEKEAWDDMEAMMDEEYRIDTEENEWRSYIEKNKEAGEIKITNIFDWEDDVTECFIFEL